MPRRNSRRCSLSAETTPEWAPWVAQVTRRPTSRSVNEPPLSSPLPAESTNMVAPRGSPEAVAGATASTPTAAAASAVRRTVRPLKGERHSTTAAHRNRAVRTIASRARPESSCRSPCARVGSRVTLAAHRGRPADGPYPLSPHSPGALGRAAARLAPRPVAGAGGVPSAEPDVLRLVRPDVHATGVGRRGGGGRPFEVLDHPARP